MSMVLSKTSDALATYERHPERLDLVAGKNDKIWLGVVEHLGQHFCHVLFKAELLGKLVRRRYCPDIFGPFIGQYLGMDRIPFSCRRVS